MQMYSHPISPGPSSRTLQLPTSLLPSSDRRELLKVSCSPNLSKCQRVALEDLVLKASSPRERSPAQGEQSKARTRTSRYKIQIHKFRDSGAGLALPGHPNSPVPLLLVQNSRRKERRQNQLVSRSISINKKLYSSAKIHPFMIPARAEL